MVVTKPGYQAEFAVSYEGSAFADYTMDVRDLAPALIALGQAFDRANALLNGDRAKITLSVRATSPGSFEISLILQQLFEEASGVLTEDFFSPAVNLREVVLGSPVAGISLLSVLKRLRGKKPKTSEQQRQGEGVLFEADNVRIYVPTEVALLYADRPMRNHLEEFVKPLLKEAVERVVIRENQTEMESIRRDEAAYFEVEKEEGQVTENIIPRQRLRVVSPVFSKEGKWRLSDGANTHWYSMKDEDFAKEVQKGRRFGIDDTLVCEVLMTQRLEDNERLRLEFTVLSVIEHIAPGEQMRLLADP